MMMTRSRIMGCTGLALLLVLPMARPAAADGEPDLATLLATAQDLRSQGDAAATEYADLVANVEDRYDQEAAAGAVDWQEWLPLVEFLAPDFAPEVQDTLAADLQSSVAPTAGADTATTAVSALRKLGAADGAATWASEWLSAGSPTAGEAVAMTQALAPGGDATVAVRTALVDAARAQSDEQVRAAEALAWQQLAFQNGDLPAEDKAALAAKLRQAYGSAAMGGNELLSVVESLRGLGDEGVDEFVAQWAAENTAWHSWTPGALGYLAGLVREDEEIPAAMAATLLSRGFFEDQEAQGEAATTISGLRLAEVVGPHLTPAQRDRWAATVEAACADQIDGGTELGRLCALLSKLGRDDPSSYAHTWMESNDQWTSWDITALQRLAGAFQNDTDSAASARRMLIEHVGGSLSALEEVKPGELNALVQKLAGDLTEAERAQWLEDIRTVLLATAWDARDLSFAGSCIKSVTGDRASAGPFVAEWMGRHANWQSWDLEGLTMLGGHLTGDGDAVAAVREGWASRVRAAVANARTELASSNGQHVRTMVRALDRCGDRREAEQLVAEWVNTSDRWQQLDLRAIAHVAHWQLRGRGETAAAARQRVGAYVLSTYLEGPETAEVGCGLWRTLAAALGPDLPAEERAAWATALETTFAPDDAAIQALAYQQAWSLCRALQLLEQRGPASRLAAEWLEAHQAEWSEVSPAHLIRLTVTALGAGRDADVSLLEDMDEIWLTQVASGGLRGSWWLIIQAWQQAGNRAKAQEWTRRAYAAMLADEDLDFGRLGWLAEILHRVKRIDGETDFTEYVQKLADMAEAGEVPDGLTWPHYYWPALVLTSDAQREALTESLVDPAGAPRLGVARVLGWSYREVGRGEQWNAFLATRIADSSGDAKALWLLARAYAERTAVMPPASLAGAQWLNEALATAEAEPLQLRIIAELANAHASAGHHDGALSLLDSVGGQFSGAGAARFVELRRGIEKHRQDYEERIAAHHAESAARREAITRRHLRRRLARARRRGDDEAVRRLERMLQE